MYVCMYAIRQKVISRHLRLQPKPDSDLPCTYLVCSAGGTFCKQVLWFLYWYIVPPPSKAVVVGI